MPQMDGIELLRRIERADPSIEVVVITTEPTRSMETLLAHRFDWVPPGHGHPYRALGRRDAPPSGTVRVRDG